MSKSHRLELIKKLSRKLSEDTIDPESDLETGSEITNPLDGCLHVFIDLGTNRGTQIRKLYEPHLFPLAPILPLYTKVETFKMNGLSFNVLIDSVFWRARGQSLL